MSYVYRHIRLDKNVPFYVGVGVGYRANQKAKRNIFWKRIVAKTKYEVEIIINGLSWDEAVEKEKEFILLYGRRDKGNGTLVNLTDGGEGMFGYKISAKTKLKISKANKGRIGKNYNIITDEYREKMRLRSIGNKYCVGRILSKRTKDKIKKARKKQPPTNEIPIVKYDLNGNFIEQYVSANDANRKTGFWACQITAACRKTNNGKSVYKKYVWKYKIEVIESNGDIKKRISIPKTELYLTTNVNKRIPKKLNSIQVEEIRKSNLSGRILGKKYNVSSTTIFDIKNNKIWKK